MGVVGSATGVLSGTGVGTGVGDGFQQLGAIGSVDPTDLHLITEGGDGGFGEFVGNQHYGQAHPDSLKVRRPSR